MMSPRRIATPRYEVGEKLLRWNGERVEVVEIIGTTGHAPFPACLRYRYEDGTKGQGVPHAIYLPGPAFLAYVAAAKQALEVGRQYGFGSPEHHAATLARATAENAAFCVHPAGVAWRRTHRWRAF